MQGVTTSTARLVLEQTSAFQSAPGSRDTRNINRDVRRCAPPWRHYHYTVCDMCRCVPQMNSIPLLSRRLSCFVPPPPRNSLVDRRVLSIVQSTAFIFVARQPENARIIGASSRRSTFPLAGVRAGRGGAGRGGEE